MYGRKKPLSEYTAAKQRIKWYMTAEDLRRLSEEADCAMKRLKKFVSKVPKT